MVDVVAVFDSTNEYFTIQSDGTYKITCYITGENVGVDTRVVLGFFLSLNDANGNWQVYGDSNGAIYLRDDDFGHAGSCTFSSIRTYEESDKIRIKTKCCLNSVTWTDTTNVANVNVWANITFEKLF